MSTEDQCEATLDRGRGPERSCTRAADGTLYVAKVTPSGTLFPEFRMCASCGPAYLNTATPDSEWEPDER